MGRGTFRRYVKLTKNKESSGKLNRINSKKVDLEEKMRELLLERSMNPTPERALELESLEDIIRKGIADVEKRIMDERMH